MNLTIRYKDGSENITKRVISGINIVGPDRIEALCHLRNEIRTFVIYNIVCVIDPETGNIDKNVWKYFGLSPEVSIPSSVSHILPAIKALNLFARQLRGFAKRERNHIIKFIIENTEAEIHDESLIDNWLRKLWCGPIESSCDIYSFTKGQALTCQAFISEIPTEQLGKCRSVAHLIARGSGRKQIPADLIDWINEYFSDDSDKISFFRYFIRKTKEAP